MAGGECMNAINYSELRRNLKSTMDKIISDHEPVIVTRRNGGNVVMVAYEDYAAIEETSYLLRSPQNAKRLRESIKSYQNGSGKEQELIEDD
jgi:antitoxin YefM